MVNHDDVISEELALFADAISDVRSPNLPPYRTGKYRSAVRVLSVIPEQREAKTDSSVNLFFLCA